MTTNPLVPSDALPPVARVAEVKGGPEDGLKAAIVDSRDTVLMLVVDREGNLHIRTELNPVALYRVLRSVTKSAAQRALAWQAGQS